jgi:cell division protein FtsQ
MDYRGRFRGPLKGISRWLTRLGAFGGVLLLAALAYGGSKGDRLDRVLAALNAARDQATHMAGLGIASIVISGNQHVSREELLAMAGVTGTTSLLFFDAERAREQLRHNPWIADATILKLYPRELQVGIQERTAFALWQKEGRVSVIAEDGTVLEPYVAPSLVQLPLVVGSGAHKRVNKLLPVLDRYPSIRDLVWASVLVSERRWNLRLKNGIEVRLPETDIASALDRLATLARDKNLLSRDIKVVDLRLRDRVSVRLSDRAAQARADALSEKLKKKAGNA